MAPGPPGSAGARAELCGEVESSRGFLRAAANPARERGRVPLSGEWGRPRVGGAVLMGGAGEAACVTAASRCAPAGLLVSGC